ncbi:MAG TPA: PhoH family protein, partial [Burkholderiaceae bacterium]|nr:PhoH family protein [Burkholderiaceae bacterium]
MPLPKPPAKRASLLSAADFDSQAAPQPGKRPQKTRAAHEPASPASVELYDPNPAAGAAPAPIALLAPVAPP